MHVVEGSDAFPKFERGETQRFLRLFLLDGNRDPLFGQGDGNLDFQELFQPQDPRRSP